MPWTGNDEHARVVDVDGLTAYRSDPQRRRPRLLPSRSRRLDLALSVADDEALNPMIATDLSERFGRGHVLQLPVTDGRPGLLRQGTGAVR